MIKSVSYSPLRYPGGKSALSSFLADVLCLNDLNGGIYYEPFAGGASIGIMLMVEGLVQRIFINDEDDEAESPVPQKAIKNLGELCLWLYGSKSKEIPPIVETQNPDLRRLDASLKNIESLAAIRSGISLVQAFELSRPTSSIFEESLLAAKRELQKARTYLTDGFDGSKELLQVAASVADLADDLYAEMERKTLPKRKKRSEGLSDV